MAAAPQMSLHDNAVQAEEHVSALTVGLAHAGASPQAIQQLQQCSSILRQVAKALAAGPSLDQSAQQGQQPSPAQPPQASPPQQPTPQQPNGQPPQPHTIGHAAIALHQAMQAAAKQQPPVPR